jgi:hypothetical protein
MQSMTDGFSLPSNFKNAQKKKIYVARRFQLPSVGSLENKINVDKANDFSIVNSLLKINKL